MRILHYMRRAMSLPPKVACAKAVGKVRRRLEVRRLRRRDALAPTYSLDRPFGGGSLLRYFHAASIDLLLPHADRIAAAAGRCLAHEFDLLGSGHVRVHHGADCPGFDGVKLQMGAQVRPDRDGTWLRNRVSAGNFDTARAVWSMVDSPYCPIDWQLDFRSGWQWSSQTWSGDIRYVYDRGADIKAPWELGRMQHLPQLAWAYAIAAAGAKGLGEPSLYVRELRNQVLDFVAANPPRFGVQWQCTMDVAIRAANIVAAHDLMLAHGASFDVEFEAVLLRSILDHGRHIVANIEWCDEPVGNHFLADLAGLLFVAAYLPCSPETDSWLAFAATELVFQVHRQFGPDGGNFEASTCYHRLSAEMAAYATALGVSLPPAKQAAACSGRVVQFGGVPARPPLELMPTTSGGKSFFPSSYFQRLLRAAQFAAHATGPDGRLVQIGDNDDGRFLKLAPGDEDPRDARGLVAALDGLFDRPELASCAGSDRLETQVVRGLIGSTGPGVSECAAAHDVAAESIRVENGQFVSAPSARVAAHGRRLEQSGASPPDLCVYPDFGLCVYRTRRLSLYVVARAAVGDCPLGHQHNDNLSFELYVDGQPLVIDGGTYVYTARPAFRNQFRATAMHNTLRLPGMEQNGWTEGPEGLFGLTYRCDARILTARDGAFAGQCRGRQWEHRRTLAVQEQHLAATDDWCGGDPATVAFHLAPGLTAEIAQDKRTAELNLGAATVRFVSDSGPWSSAQGLHSPSYGVVRNNQVLELTGAGGQIRWSIQVV